jgi:hypothetical protein
VIIIINNKSSKKNSQEIKLIYYTKEVTVTPEDLDQTKFSGVLVNNRGEVYDNSYNGILLSDLLTQKGVDLAQINNIEVTAFDGYHAKVTREEIMEPDRVYLALKLIEGIEEGVYSPQLIVFNEESKKRAVRVVKEITLNAR